MAKLGNQNITTFQYASLIKLGSTYENNGYTFGGVGYTGAALPALPILILPGNVQP
jgi:hypothetical protein